MCELVHYCGLTHNSMQIELNKNNNKNINIFLVALTLLINELKYIPIIFS